MDLFNDQEIVVANIVPKEMEILSISDCIIYLAFKFMQIKRINVNKTNDLLYFSNSSYE